MIEIEQISGLPNIIVIVLTQPACKIASNSRARIGAEQPYRRDSDLLFSLFGLRVLDVSASKRAGTHPASVEC
jgi:hypothetical protein